MSAFMAAKYADRVDVLSDGAVYSEDGTVMGFERKIWKSDRLPLVFVGRGDALATRAMGAAVEMAERLHKTFDATLECLQQKIEARADSGAEQAALDGILAGISETRGPVIAYFHTYQEDYPVEPFKFHDVPQEITCGSDPEPRALHESGLPMFWAIDGLRQYGPTFFDVMRQFPMQHLAHPDKPWVYAIGGHLDLATVTADGVTIERIHEWPDEIGQKINPHPMMDGAALIAHFEKHGSIEIFN